MLVLTRDKSGRLIRSNFIMGGKIDAPIPILQDHYYPLCTSLPSCMKVLVVTGNNYELKPPYISVPLKFTESDSEDVYITICEFQEVYVMIKLQNLLVDVINLRITPFALKDNSKM